jgi:hypothetical protein
MDPVSITSGALSVIVSCAKISDYLNDYIRKVQNADENIRVLEIEIKSLLTVLNSIKLKESDSSLAVKLSELSGPEKEYWKNFGQAMNSCESALKSLEQILPNVNSGGIRFIRRATLQYKLEQNSNIIASLKQQISAHRQTLDLYLQLIAV